MAPANELQSIIIAIGAILLLIVGVIIYAVVHRNLKGLDEMTALALNLSNGKLEKTLMSFNSRNELGVLADSFRHLRDSIIRIMSDMRIMGEKHSGGEYDYLIRGKDYKGDYSKVIDGINEVTKVSSTDLGDIMDAFAALSKGKHNTQLRRFPGKKMAITDSFNSIKDNIINRETMLEDALHEAQIASRAKSDFLANMSHEMRTPLNAIIGMTQLGLMAEEKESKVHALNKISDASSHLLGLVNDILDMAKIKADKLELYPAPYNFEHMIDKVLGVIRFSMDEKQHELTVDIDKEIPDIVIGDEQRLAQVITNILANAVKFTPDSGKIRFDVFLDGKTDTGCELRVEVTDNGIGISPEQQNKLFDIFEQAESSSIREYGGSGLGLAISKRIIEMMGGQIWVESELGKGASFIFTVKVNIGIEEEIEENVEIIDLDSFTDKRLLIVEDAEINREILIALLDGSGLIIDCAENGKEAYEKVAADPEKYDIIFMDIQMPQMDGFDATRQIRALPARQRGRLPIIAMTAKVFQEDIDACAAADMDGHLGKPLDFYRVQEVLKKYLAQ